MKYIFNFEDRGKTAGFNREKVLLSAMLDPEQLYYMLDTQYDGIYPAEALDRKRRLGPNSLKKIAAGSAFHMLEGKKEMVESALEQLYRQDVAVLRRNEYFFTEISCEDVVPGDVVFVSQGDIIPADIRIIFSKELSVDQSLYGHGGGIRRKGTSYKQVDMEIGQITDLPNMCFAGSRVVGGLARGVVVDTGASSYLGHLLMM